MVEHPDGMKPYPGVTWAQRLQRRNLIDNPPLKTLQLRGVIGALDGDLGGFDPYEESRINDAVLAKIKRGPQVPGVPLPDHVVDFYLNHPDYVPGDTDFLSWRHGNMWDGYDTSNVDFEKRMARFRERTGYRPNWMSNRYMEQVPSTPAPPEVISNLLDELRGAGTVDSVGSFDVDPVRGAKVLDEYPLVHGGYKTYGSDLVKDHMGVGPNNQLFFRDPGSLVWDPVIKEEGYPHYRTTTTVDGRGLNAARIWESGPVYPKRAPDLFDILFTDVKDLPGLLDKTPNVLLQTDTGPRALFPVSDIPSMPRASNVVSSLGRGEAIMRRLMDAVKRINRFPF